MERKLTRSNGTKWVPAWNSDKGSKTPNCVPGPSQIPGSSRRKGRGHVHHTNSGSHHRPDTFHPMNKLLPNPVLTAPFHPQPMWPCPLTSTMIPDFASGFSPHEFGGGNIPYFDWTPYVYPPNQGTLTFPVLPAMPFPGTPFPGGALGGGFLVQDFSPPSSCVNPGYIPEWGTYYSAQGFREPAYHFIGGNDYSKVAGGANEDGGRKKRSLTFTHPATGELLDLNGARNKDDANYMTQSAFATVNRIYSEEFPQFVNALPFTKELTHENSSEDIGNLLEDIWSSTSSSSGSNKDLRKLLPSLLSWMDACALDSSQKVSLLAASIYKQAMDDPEWSRICVVLVQELTSRLPQDLAKLLRKEILNRCQGEFRRTVTDLREEVLGRELHDGYDDFIPFFASHCHVGMPIHQKRLANVRLMSQLFKLRLLTTRIVCECVDSLMEILSEESYRLLLSLLMTVGKDLELSLRNRKPRSITPLNFYPETSFMTRVFRVLWDSLVNHQSLHFSPGLCASVLELIELRQKGGWLKSDGDAVANSEAADDFDQANSSPLPIFKDILVCSDQKKMANLELVKEICKRPKIFAKPVDLLCWYLRNFPWERNISTLLLDLCRVVLGLGGAAEEEKAGAGDLVSMMVENHVINRHQTLDALEELLPELLAENFVYIQRTIMGLVDCLLMKVFISGKSLSWLVQLTRPLVARNREMCAVELITVVLHSMSVAKGPGHVRVLWKMNNMGGKLGPNSVISVYQIFPLFVNEEIAVVARVAKGKIARQL